MGASSLNTIILIFDTTIIINKSLFIYSDTINKTQKASNLLKSSNQEVSWPGIEPEYLWRPVLGLFHSTGQAV
jgi:hypothetical protein